MKKRSNLKKYLIAFFLIIVAGALFLWYRQDPNLSLENLFSQKKDTAAVVKDDEKVSGSDKVAPHDAATSQTTDKEKAPAVTINETELIEDEKGGLENEGQPAGVDCETGCAAIDTFYAHLDKQTYIQEYKLPQPSKEYFSHLIVKLAQNPPVITRETDDLFTILKNTAHFFRIIGKQNIQLIKGILDQEKDSVEEILADFYALSNNPECLKTRMGLDIPDKALYNYAGFFLNTMGGRLYLFRRDSFSRLPVSYYSIMLIDRANREGTNSDGIDIRPAIDALIDELENTGNQLKLKETYLDELYALKEKYPQEQAQ